MTHASVICSSSFIFGLEILNLPLADLSASLPSNSSIFLAAVIGVPAAEAQASPLHCQTSFSPKQTASGGENCLTAQNTLGQ